MSVIFERKVYALHLYVNVRWPWHLYRLFNPAHWEEVRPNQDDSTYPFQR